MEKKITKRENFTAIVNALEEMNLTDLADVMKHEIELLDKKASYKSDKPTARQKENAALKEQILSAMTPGQKYRCSEIQALVPDLAKEVTAQRTVRLVSELYDNGNGALDRTVEKKIVYYSLKVA